MSKRANTFEDPLMLEAALEGLELQKRRIELQIAEVRSRLGRRPRVTTPSIGSSDAPAAKRHLSAEARRRIAAAQKKRWAEYRKSNANSK